MASKQKASSRKAQRAPAVPDQQPPLSEEQPPLPDEQPPLPDEQPPLPEEQPPLPEEVASEALPPLPNEPVRASSSESNETDEKQDVNPTQREPDAWQAIWEPSANAYYFYNSETQESTWLNPRLPPDEAAAHLANNPPTFNYAPDNYTLPQSIPAESAPDSVYDPETGEYGFTARFNARTGKFQNNPEHTAENFSTQGQIMRESREYFDVSVMSQGMIVGKSGGALKADRRPGKIPKAQLKELIKRKREKKDKAKREWYANDDVIVRKH